MKDPQIKFIRERKLQHPKRLFFFNNRPINVQINNTIVIRPVKKASHFLPQSIVSHRSDPGSEVEYIIIGMDSNITDKIIRKVINVWKEKFRTINGALKNSSSDWILLQILFIQNHPRPSILEKRWNYAKYPTWNFRRCDFAKESSIPNPAKSKCHSSSNLRLIENHINSIRCSFQKICS